MKNNGNQTEVKPKTSTLYYPENTIGLKKGVCVKGKIYTNEKCPECKAKLIHNELEEGFICGRNPKHPLVIPKNCRVKFGRQISKRYSNHRYFEALQFLRGLQFKTIEGTLDARDYKKDNALGFETQALKWLNIKKNSTKPNTYRNLKRDIFKAIGCWGQTNIKIIGYGEIEDFLFGLPVGEKTRNNTKSCIHDFFTWAVKREKIPMPDMPDCKFELGWRTIVDFQIQQKILEKIKEISWNVNPKIWIGIRWLSTYVSIRPNELRNLKEKEININGFFVIPDPKRKSLN